MTSIGMTSIGHAATANGSRYLQQLCKHWSHRFAVDFTATAGTIRFADATAVLAADAAGLTVTITAEDAAVTARMQGVIAEHLDRFAFREAPLPFHWQQAA